MLLFSERCLLSIRPLLLAYKKATICSFLCIFSILMGVPIPLLHQCPGRSILTPNSILEAALRPKSSDVRSPADEGVFPSWISSRVFYGATPVCDLPIRDLTCGGLTEFRLLTNEHPLKRSFLGKTAFNSTPRSWRNFSHPTSDFSASSRFGRLLHAVGRLPF